MQPFKIAPMIIIDTLSRGGQSAVVHSLPFQIDYNGNAEVSTYFQIEELTSGGL